MGRAGAQQHGFRNIEARPTYLPPGDCDATQLTLSFAFADFITCINSIYKTAEQRFDALVRVTTPSSFVSTTEQS